MTRTALFLTLWTLAAGAGIPFVGLLNSGMARSVGNPAGATAVMFAVGFAAALGLTIAFDGLPVIGRIGAAPASSFGAGLLMVFYALSATVIIPRLGAGRFVAFILVAQLSTAAAIDHFGWFGIARRPLDMLRLGGFALILCGIALMQASARHDATP